MWKLGLQPSLLSPGLPLRFLLWLGGQCRKGEEVGVGGEGKESRVEGSSPLICSWKETRSSSSSLEASMV